MLILDTHVLLWLVRDAPLAAEAKDAIEDAQNAAGLYVSAITAWELGAAELKRTNRPDLGMQPGLWFRQAVKRVEAKLATITPAVSAEAASVPAIYGRGDPGDCFMIATARVRRLKSVTRDASVLRLAAERPGYVRVLEC